MAQNPADTSMWGKAITANARRDNGATVLMGGNIETTNDTVTNAPDMTITGAGREKQPKPYNATGASAATKANVGTAEVFSGRQFAVMDAGNYIVKGGNITTTLAGVAYTGLRSAGNPMQIRNPHTLLTRKTLIITNWYYTTGGIISSSTSDDNFGASHTRATRALPGNVTTLPTGKVPVDTAIPSKTG